MEMNCTVGARIRLLKGGWMVAEPDDDSEYVRDLTVKLSIIGDDQGGYHLVMEPEGCFTADDWHESIQAAKDNAAEAFGVTDSDWENPDI